MAHERKRKDRLQLLHSWREMGGLPFLLHLCCVWADGVRPIQTRNSGISRTPQLPVDGIGGILHVLSGSAVVLGYRMGLHEVSFCVLFSVV
jgi:hypothetical protein